MTDTNGPQSGEPQEAASGRAPQEPTRPIPTAFPGQPPAGSAYPTAALPAAGASPVPATGRLMPLRRMAHGPVLAWVLGGVLVALLASGAGFAGGFVVGHAVGSHNSDRSASQSDNRTGPFGGYGMGQWSDKGGPRGNGSGRGSGPGTRNGPGMVPAPGSAPSATPSPGA